MEVVHHGSSRIVPSSDDWSSLRPIVTELYQNRRMKMAEVRDHLEALGYRVNTRMIRMRITQWNLQRNHQVWDMVAALRLLDPDPSRWVSPEPLFLIRGRTVTINEVLRFFRRKGIRDPLQWAWSTTMSREDRCVRLLDADLTSDSTGGGAHPTPASSSSHSSTSDGFNISPQILTLEQTAVANIHSYCSAYVGLGHAAAQQEPQIHQFTIHGRFGDRMQEGLAQMIRNGPEAFPNFSRGFELIQDLLSNCHPMSLAQFLAVVCELAAHDANAVLGSLLRYSTMMASSLRVSNQLVGFLLALKSSPDISRIAISSLRAALGAFSAQQPLYWQKLYVQERLCDCLYHGKERTEGSFHRASLFKDQEEFYGFSARNVLWTLTNVADDQLHLGNLEAGKASYMEALLRADNLSGFGRAKIRFAALEGLAQVEQLQFEKLSRQPQNIGLVSTTSHLQEAYQQINGALNEALIWFDPSSRRISRAAERRAQILMLLADQNQPQGLENCQVSESAIIEDPDQFWLEDMTHRGRDSGSQNPYPGNVLLPTDSTNEFTVM